MLPTIAVTPDKLNGLLVY